MSSKTLLSLLFFGILSTAGCGGGGGSSTPPPPPPTITSVSASCNPTSVAAGQTVVTSQCTASVVGTGSYSSAVTWSAKYGTITSAGVYTAPATVPASGMDTVTATSTEDPTKSGPANITITAAVPPTITSVSASCLPVTLQAHTTQTSQCSATVTGTGSYSSAVTWSAKYGAITTAGVYTAPLTVPTSGSDTITATSTEDITKSGPTNIAITAARVITLTPVYPTISLAEVPGSPFTVQINATGILAGDVIDTTLMGAATPYTIAAADVTNGKFTVSISIDDVASFVQFACGSPTSANAVCNTAWIAITTDQQELVENKAATIAYFNPGEVFDVQEYTLPAGTFSTNATLEGSNQARNSAITLDGGASGTGTLLTDDNLQGVDSNAGSQTTGVITQTGTYPTDEFASIVAWNTYGYVTEPNVAITGNLGRFSISTTNGLGTITTVPAGESPYALDAATVNSADAIVVYSGQDVMVHLFDNTPAAEGTPVALSNITPFLTVENANKAPTPTAAVGGWPLRIIGSGSAVGTVGLLSSYDGVLDFLTISGTNTLSWPAGASVTFTGNPHPYLIAPDPTHGAFIVALADTTNGVTTLERISATTPYTVTPITPSPAFQTGFLASGLTVSNDGTEIYVAGFNTLNSVNLSNPTPLFIEVPNP